MWDGLCAEPLALGGSACPQRSLPFHVAEQMWHFTEQTYTGSSHFVYGQRWRRSSKYWKVERMQDLREE